MPLPPEHLAALLFAAVMTHAADRLDRQVVLGGVATIVVVLVPAISADVSAVRAGQVARARQLTGEDELIDALAGLALVAISRRRGRRAESKGRTSLIAAASARVLARLALCSPVGWKVACRPAMAAFAARRVRPLDG